MARLAQVKHLYLRKKEELKQRTKGASAYVVNNIEQSY